jgi:hypothetical protein
LTDILKITVSTFIVENYYSQPDAFSYIVTGNGSSCRRQGAGCSVQGAGGTRMIREKLNFLLTEE